jgi:hypothetical protein
MKNLGPVVPQMSDRDRALKKQQFLVAFAKCGLVAQACRDACVGSKTVYRWRQGDDVFAEQWEEIESQVNDALEAEAMRRAVEGVKRPVFHQGEHVGDVTDYSDSLLIQLLKARKPEKFRERTELTGANGGPVTINAVIEGAGVALASKLAAVVELRRASGSPDSSK